LKNKNSAIQKQVTLTFNKAFKYISTSKNYKKILTQQKHHLIYNVKASGIRTPFAGEIAENFTKIFFLNYFLFV
jgi:hypothetical protein